MSHPVASAVALLVLVFPACGDDDGVAHVAIHNDFDNPQMASNPPWTICNSSYLGVELGKIEIGKTSAEVQLTPGLDHVLMVAAWADPACSPEHCLPIATRNEEEVVDGQHRTIAINMPNHQGPCPPQGIQPIPEALYDRILALWPGYGFKPYAERTKNPQCTP